VSCDYYRVAPELLSIHDKLENIIYGLGGLQAKESVSDTAVSKYTDQLSKIDAMYKEGRFEIDTPQGKMIPEGQEVCVGLLEKAHKVSIIIHHYWEQ